MALLLAALFLAISRVSPETGMTNFVIKASNGNRQARALTTDSAGGGINFYNEPGFTFTCFTRLAWYKGQTAGLAAPSVGWGCFTLIRK